MENRIKKILRYGVIRGTLHVLITILLVLALVWIVKAFNQSNFDMSFYQLQSDKVSDNIRIVLLSDLHLKEFGKDNCRLVEKIKDLKPDIITMVGDMNISGKEDYSVVITLAKQLEEVAPVYYSYGNNEFYDVLFKKSKIRSDLKKVGVTVLSNQYEKVKIKDDEIIIGGFSTDKRTFGDTNVRNFLEKFDKQTGFKLLLSHFPEIFEDKMQAHKVDLALCGHAHGGQIRIPFVGGLYAHGQGLFPKLTQGMHKLNGSNVVISRGLGSDSFIPRFNNNPEIVTIDIDKY